MIEGDPKFNIDMFFVKTQPQLQASIPLNSSHSQPMVAPKDVEMAVN